MGCGRASSRTGGSEGRRTAGIRTATSTTRLVSTRFPLRLDGQALCMPSEEGNWKAVCRKTASRGPRDLTRGNWKRVRPASAPYSTQIRHRERRSWAPFFVLTSFPRGTTVERRHRSFVVPMGTSMAVDRFASYRSHHAGTVSRHCPTCIPRRSHPLSSVTVRLAADMPAPDGRRAFGRLEIHVRVGRTCHAGKGEGR